MNQPLAAYIEWIELMTFFSGYVVLYALVYVLSGIEKGEWKIGKELLARLPISYALVATLYWGLVIKNWYPGFEMATLRSSVFHPFLRIWGLIAILAWIPFFQKRPVYSLVHSLVFFVLMLKDLVMPAADKAAAEISRQNNLRVFGGSIGIHLLALLAVTIISILVQRLRKAKKAV